MVALAEGEKRPLFAMLDALRPLGTSFVPPPGDVAARAPSPVIDAVRRASRQAGVALRVLASAHENCLGKHLLWHHERWRML